MKVFRQIPLLLFALLLFTGQALPQSLTGYVLDVSGGFAIPGAQVTAVSANGDSMFYIALTDPSGAYVIDNILPGVYDMMVSHPNYLPGSTQGVVINPNSPPVVVYFQLTPISGSGSGTISGTVFDNQTLATVSGVNIRLVGNGVSIWASSDNDGDYFFDTVPEGIYSLSAFASGYEYYAAPNLVVVAPDTQITGLDIYLEPQSGSGLADLQGVVLDTSNYLPIENATVSLYTFGPAGDSLLYTTTTMPGGVFQFSEILPGVYTVICQAEGYFPFFLQNFTVEEGFSNSLTIFLTPFNLNNFGTISGQVLSDSSGEGIAGAVLEFTAVNGMLSFLAFSGPAGSYSGEVPPGSYIVSCQVGIPGTAGFYSEYYDDVQDITQATPVSVSANTVTPGIDFGVPVNSSPASASLSGNVLSADSISGINPVHPAQITAYSFNPATGDSLVYSTTNQPDGSYLIPEMVPGIYNIVISAAGYNTARVNGFTVNPGPNALTVYLGPVISGETGTIAGTVIYDGDGTPVFPAFLEFISFSGVSYSTVTGPLGDYSFDLPVGSYVVSVMIFDPAGAPIYQEFYDDAFSIANATVVTVDENSITGGIDFGVPNYIGTVTGSISGRVTDNSSNPLAGALVTLQSIDNGGIWSDSLVFTALTGPDGYYSINFTAGLLPFNLFVASAQKPGYQIEFWNEKPTFNLADPIFFFGDSLGYDVNFTLAPGNSGGNNSISGQLTGDNGTVLSGAFVVSSNLLTGELLFTFSDSSGHYFLGGLMNAPHVLLYAADGHVPEFYDDALVWEDATPVLANGDVLDINATLTGLGNNNAPGMIAGTVRNDLGQGISGVLVTIRDVSSGQVIGYDFSDGQGGYQIAGVHDGALTVQASKISYISEAQSVQMNTSSGNMMMVNFDLSNSPLGLELASEAWVPSQLELGQNYPNPFNPETRIRFGLPQAQQVRLVIYNILGQTINTLVDENLSAGSYEYTWNGSDARGQQVASGIYLYSLETGSGKIVRKMLLTR